MHALYFLSGQIIEKSQDLMIQVFKQLCDAIGSNPLLLAKNLYENHYITDSDYTNANDSDLLNIALDDVDLRTATLLNSIIRVIKKGNLEILPEIIDQLQHQSMGRKLKQKYGKNSQISMSCYFYTIYIQKKLFPTIQINHFMLSQ